jgi:hypothetical protein
VINSLATGAIVAAHPEWYQMLASWGNIGSLLGGLAAFGLAIVAVIQGSAGLGDWRAKQRAQQDLARAEAENIRLDRERVLYGWSPGGLEVYGVTLVTQPDEAEAAASALAAGGLSDFVIVKVTERAEGNENRANDLRNMIVRTGYLARAPETGEYEAITLGRRILLDRQAETA